MKFVVLFAAVLAVSCSVASAEDLICKMGAIACTINCMASGHTNGYCDENGECECNKKEKREARTELVCMIAGQLGCEINCLTSTGHFAGECDENNDCICEGHKPTATPEPEARSELICLLGGNLACEINCLTSTGHFQGECDEDNECICGEREQTTTPETRRRRALPKAGDLACRHGGDDVCASFCHWTTGKNEGYCDDEDNCMCEPKP